VQCTDDQRQDNFAAQRLSHFLIAIFERKRKTRQREKGEEMERKERRLERRKRERKASNQA